MRHSIALVAFLATAVQVGTVSAQVGTVSAQDEKPRVLCVQAHPDDEIIYAATLFGIVRHLEGDVDLAVITDGSAGYAFAEPAERIYDTKLATESHARRNLPAVRKREMLASAEILGLRNVFFLDEDDHMYTVDVDTVLQHVWNTERVRERLTDIMIRAGYDFVFTMLPTEDNHGHHKGAAILTLQAANSLPTEVRPAVVGATVADTADPPPFLGLPTYPLTEPRTSSPDFSFDRATPLEDDSVLTYQIIVNWVIAEHKSQGRLQRGANRRAMEHFWLFAMNTPAAVEKSRALFRRLEALPP